MGFGSDRAEQNLKSTVSSCKNFQPNIFNKTKCQNCFRTREAHQLDNDGDNQKSKKVIICGYLFVAPGLDVNNPSSRSRKWQRRFFVFYESGDLNYALDENPSTIPQGTINMYECTDVFTADDKTGHDYSMGITVPDNTTYIRAEVKEEKERWFSVLSEYPQINRAAAKSKSKKREREIQQPQQPPPQPVSQIQSKSIQRDELSNRGVSTDRSKPRDRRPIPVDRYSDVFPQPQRSIYDSDRPSRNSSLSSKIIETKDKNKNYEMNKEAPRTKKTTSESSVSSISSSDSRGGMEYDQKPEPPRFQGAKKQYETISDVPKAKLMTGYQSQHPDTKRRPSTDKAGMQRELAESHDLFPTLKEQFENPETLKSGSLDSRRYQRGEPYASRWYSQTDKPPADIFSGMDDWVWNENTQRFEDVSHMEDPPSNSVRMPTTRSDYSSTKQIYDDSDQPGSESQPIIKPERKTSGLKGVDGVLAPSKRNIERRRHQQERRNRHTLDVGAIAPTRDLLEEKKDEETEEQPEPRKRSNSDPNVREDIEKMRPRSYPGFGDIIHLKKGWLIKRENEKDWAKHWFVLSDNTLKSYSDSRAEEADKEDDCIHLSTCKEVKEIDVHRNYGFEIELTDSDPIVVAAMTNGIRNNWIQAIRKAVAALPPSADESSDLSDAMVTMENSREMHRLPSVGDSSGDEVDSEHRIEEKALIHPLTSASPSSLREVEHPVPSRKLPPDVDYMLGRKADLETSTPLKKEGQRKSSPIKFESNPAYLTSLEAIRSPTRVRMSPMDQPSRKTAPKYTSSSAECSRGDRTSPSQVSVDTDEDKSSDSEEEGDSGSEGEEDTESASEQENDILATGETKLETGKEEINLAGKVKDDTEKHETGDDDDRTSVSESSDFNSEPEEFHLKEPQDKSGEAAANITSSSGETMLVELLEAEVESLKAQLEKTQQELVEAHQQNIELKTQMTTARRDHRESISELDAEQHTYMTQIEDMNTHQDQIAQRNQQLQVELKESKNISEITKQQLHQLKKKLSEANQTISRQENEIQQLQTKLDIAVTELSESEQVAQGLRVDLKVEKNKTEALGDVLSEKNEKLESKIADLRNALKTAEADISAKDKLISDLERSHHRQDPQIKIEHLMTKLEEAKQRLKDSEQDLVKNEERFEKRYSRLQSKAQAEREALEEKLKLSNEKIAQLVEEKALKEQRARKESEKLDEEWHQQEDKIEELLHQLKDEMTVKSELQEKLDEAESKLAELTLGLQGDALDVTMPTPKTDLDKRLEESERKLKEAQHNLQMETDANLHLQEELKRLKAMVNTLQKQNDTLQGKSSDEDSGKDKIRNLRQKLDEATADKVVAEEYLEASAREIKELKAALQEESSRVAQLADQLQKARSELDTRPTQQHSSSDEASDLITQIQQLEEEQESLRKQLEENLKVISKLKVELEDKTVELEDISAKLQDTLDENRRLSTDLEKCQTHKGSIQEQILQQTVEISQLRRQLQQMKNTSQEQEKELTDKVPEVDELRENVTSLEKEIDSLKKDHQEEMTKKIRELEELGETLADAEKKVDDAERRLQEERNRISSLEANLAKEDPKDEIDGSGLTTKQLKAKYESALQEIKKLRNDLKQANNAYDDLEFQYLQIKEENRRAKANFDEQMDLMCNRIQDLTTKLAISDRKLRENEKRVGGLERKLGNTSSYSTAKPPSRELESKLEELELKLYDVEGTLKAQEEETDSLKGIIGSVEEKVASREETAKCSVEPQVSSCQENKSQSVPNVMATNSSSSKTEITANKKTSTESTGSESDDSDSSVPREKTENPKQKRLMRMKSLESKLLDTEQKLKQITAKLVDVTTKELDNRKAYHNKCVSENKLKEQVKDSKAKLETLSKQLEQEHTIRVRIVGEVSNQLTELELKLESMETNVADAKLKISDFLQEVHRYKASLDKNALDNFAHALTEVEKHVQETKETLIRAEKALEVQEGEITELENPEISRKRSALRKLSAGSQSSEASLSKSEISLRSMDDAVNSTIDLLRDQLLQADERLQEKETEIVAQEKAVRSQRIEHFADKLAFEAIKLGEMECVLQQVKEKRNQQKTVKLEVPEDSEKKDEARPSSPVEEFAETLSNRILMQGSLGATLSRVRTQDNNAMDRLSEKDEQSDSEGEICQARRNVSPRRAISEPLSGSAQSDDDSSHVGEFASSLAEQALKQGEMTYVIETKVKDLQHQLTEAYRRLEHQQVRLKKLTALCDEGKVEEMRELVNEDLALETVEEVSNCSETQFASIDNVPVMSAGEITDTSGYSDNVTLDTPELASIAKQIELEETRRFANDYASGEIVRAEMIRILQRVMEMYEKEINMERASCMQMLKVQRQAAERKYASIEHSIRDEMSHVIEEIKDRYETELEKLKQKGRQEEHTEQGIGPLFNNELMNKFIDIVARRAVLSNHLTSWVDSKHAVLHDVKPQHRRHSLSALTLYTNKGDCMLVYQERLLAKCSSMDDYAEMLAQRAIFQAELMYIVNKLQSEQKEQLQALREAYEKVSNGKVIETITMEHARNIGSVRERYEAIIRDEREEQAKVMRKFQEELDRTKSELGNLLKEIKEKEKHTQKTGNPEIQFTLEDDLNDQVEEMTARRVKHLTEELDRTKEKLNTTLETLKVKTDEHIKEVDTITDVMEKLKEKQEAEMSEIKQKHIEEMDVLKTEHNEIVSTQTHAHQKELTDLQANYEEELERIVEEYNLKVTELKESIDMSKEEEITSLKQKHEEDMQRVHNECEQRISEASEEIADLQQEEINQLKEKHEEMLLQTKDQYERRLSTVSREMLDFKEQHESDVKDLQDKHNDTLCQKEEEVASLVQQYEDKLRIVTDDYEIKLKALNTKYLDFKEMHESEVKELQERCRELELSQKLQEELQNLKDQHEDEMRLLSKECEKKLKDAETQMLDMKELHESEIKELQEKHEEEVTKIEKDCEEKIKDVEEDMVQLEEDFQKEIVELKAKYEIEVIRLKKECDERLAGDSSEPCSPQLKSPSEQKIANVRREYEQRLSKVKVENEKRMSHLQETYEDEISKLRAAEEKKAKQMVQRHEEQIGRMRKEQEMFEAELEKRYQREIDRIQVDQQYKTEELGQKYEDAIEKIRQRHHEEVALLNRKHKQEVEDLKNEYEEKLDNFAELHENDLQAVKMAQVVNNVQSAPLHAESSPQQHAQLPQQSLVTALREKYEKGLEQFLGGDDLVLKRAHQSHRDAIDRLRRRDQEEIEKLKQERDSKLSVETEATLLALKSATKRHDEDLERERAKFRTHGNGNVNEKIEAMRREHQEELERIEQEMVVVSKQYAAKCMESSAMEEQLATLQHSLEEKKRSIQHLRAENTQLNEKMAEEIAALRSTLGDREGGTEQGAGAAGTEILDLYEVKINLRIKESETQAMQEEIDQLRLHLEQTKQEENELFAEKYKKLKQEHEGTEEKVRYLERKLNEAYDKLKEADVRKVLAPHTFETKTKQPSKSNLDRERSYSESNLSEDFPGRTTWYSEENLRRPSPDIRLGTFIPMETKKSPKAKSASSPASYSGKSSLKKTERPAKKVMYKTADKQASIKKKDKTEKR